MGLTRHKVSYVCDCGVDYGSCGAKCAYVFVHNRTVDVYSIFHVDTHRYLKHSEEDPGITEVDCIGANALSALIKLLTENPTENPDEGEKLTEIEKEKCKP